MLLEPAEAAFFIDHYKKLLLEIGRGRFVNASITKALVDCRLLLEEDPSQLGVALERLHARGDPVDDAMVQAVAGMQVRQWVYLRDTRSHSVFIDPQAEFAYGVLGVTQRLRDVLGDSGTVLTAGVLPFRGRLVCDGLLADPVWLGPGYRRSFNDMLSGLRAQGRWRTDALEATAQLVEPAVAKRPPRRAGSTAAAKAKPVSRSRTGAGAVEKEDPDREHRIDMEAVVDCYDEIERAMGWYYYLEGRIKAPFTATCTARRVSSPLKVGDTVRVLSLAPEEECERDMLVCIAWDDEELAVPLAQLAPATRHAATRQAVADWHYWVARGYRF